MIGDVDPEDAYDADDGLEDRILVLERTVADMLGSEPDPRREIRRAQALERVDRLGEVPPEYQSRVDAVRQALEDMWPDGQ